MSAIFWKNIYLCVPKFKCLPTNLSPPPVNDDHENATQINDNAAAAAAALIKNFNSIYDTSVNSVSTGSKSVPFSSAEEYHRFSNSSSSDDDEYSDHDDCYNPLEYFSGNPPDFSSVFASRRFFFSSPGKSNSIIDYYSPKEKISPLSPPLPPPPPPLSTLPPPPPAVENGIVAVQIQTYSPDPYADFKRSMQEMVEAHELIKDLKADWNYLHELLLCYLSLNPKNTHKLIICAFTDLIVSLTSTTSSSNHSGHRKTDCVDDNNRHTTTSTHDLLP